jgi:hypothetical protein
MILSFSYVYILQNQTLISSPLTEVIRHKTPHKFHIELSNWFNTILAYKNKTYSEVRHIEIS